MAVDIRAIREAVADQIETFVGVRSYAFPVQSDVYPRVMVMNDTPMVRYHESFGPAVVDVDLLVEVATRAMDPVSAQETIAAYISSGTGFSDVSIPDALEDVATGETSPTLGGRVLNTIVNEVSVSDGIDTGTGTEYAATFRVTVRARRD